MYPKNSSKIDYLLFFSNLRAIGISKLDRRILNMRSLDGAEVCILEDVERQLEALSALRFMFSVYI